MGMFATLNGEKYTKCPKCNNRASWQSKGLWLNYKGRDIWIGDEGNIELDENMNGHIVAYCWSRKDGLVSDGCGKITYYKIRKGKLIESSENEYMNFNNEN